MVERAQAARYSPTRAARATISRPEPASGAGLFFLARSLSPFARRAKRSRMTDRTSRRPPGRLGLGLPQPIAPVANYVPFVRVGDLVHISGQVSVDAAGGIKGVVGEDVDLAEAQRAARLCGLNLIAQIKAACEGDLDRVRAGGEAWRLCAGRPRLLRHPQGDQRLLRPDGRGVRRRRPPRPLGGRRLSPAAELRRRGRRGRVRGRREAIGEPSSARPGSGCSRPPIAHRGLWSPGGRAGKLAGAFQAACAAGYGIELDVQLSADGEAMVFHDATLERMTGAERPPRRPHGRRSRRELRAGGRGRDDPDARRRPDPGRPPRHGVHRAEGAVRRGRPAGAAGARDPDRPQRARPASSASIPIPTPGSPTTSPRVLRGLSSYGYADADARHLAPELRKSFARLEHVGDRPAALPRPRPRHAAQPARRGAAQGRPAGRRLDGARAARSGTRSRRTATI